MKSVAARQPMLTINRIPAPLEPLEPFEPFEPLEPLQGSERAYYCAMSARSVMNRPAVSAGLTVLTLLAAAAPIAAHHSFAAEYDRNRTITVTGAVTKLEWTNPHARL